MRDLISEMIVWFGFLGRSRYDLGSSGEVVSLGRSKNTLTWLSPRARSPCCPTRLFHQPVYFDSECKTSFPVEGIWTALPSRMGSTCTSRLKLKPQVPVLEGGWWARDDLDEVRDLAQCQSLHHLHSPEDCDISKGKIVKQGFNFFDFFIKVV